jgi:single-strand DNA-binding protein
MAFCKIMLIGNLGRDPEMRYTPSGRPVTQFSVAVSNSKPDGQGGWVDEGTDWYRVSVFGDRAERAAEQLRKGNRVFVEGRFKTREFEGNDGQKRTSLDVTADNVISLDRKGRDDDAAFAGVPGRRSSWCRRRRWWGSPGPSCLRRHRPRRPSLLIRRPTTDASRPSQEARRLLP